MDKIAVSRKINRLTGGDDELFCYRVYIHARLWGSFWIWFEVAINVAFILLRGERSHIARSYHYQRRCHNATKKKAYQIASQKTQGKASGNETSQVEGAP